MKLPIMWLCLVGRSVRDCGVDTNHTKLCQGSITHHDNMSRRENPKELVDLPALTISALTGDHHFVLIGGCVGPCHGKTFLDLKLRTVRLINHLVGSYK